jgi:iron complex outermembrane receptor protein
MMCARKKWLARAVALVVALIAAPAWAQSSDATLKGVVRDAGKNPVAGATVTATHEATKVSKTTTSGADGSYAFVLPPGSYAVQVTAPRFWGPRLPVELAAGAESQVDFSLIPMMTEVLTVTATKHESDPIDVPFSLEAHSEEDLRNRGADDIEDVAANVAGFSVQSLGPGQSQVAIRGVSSGQIARDQPGVKEQVGVYLDESPVSLSLYTPDLDLVDVGRVEVLRGPQGTLFGAGSETGTVRYISNVPALKASEGFVEFGGAGVQEGSGAGDLKAAINVPMGEHSAARIVGYYSRLAGYTDAIQPDQSVDDDVNEGYRKGARAAFTFAPNEKLSITPRVVVQDVEWSGWNLQDIYNILANPFTTTRPAVTFGDREEFTQLDEEVKDDFTLGDVTLKYDFGGGLALSSITSYVDRKIRVIRDTTALTASFTANPPLGAPEPIYTLDSPLYDNTDAEVWTQELRLSGEKERLRWVGGLFYTHSERDYGQDVTIPGFTAATGIPTQGLLAPEDSIYYSQFEYTLEQYALFGEATMSLTDRFGLTAGLRYYDYDEDKKQLVDGVFGNPDFGNSILSLPGSTDADGVVPRVIGTYKLSDDSIFNAQVSAGFRLGGINDPLNTALCSDEDEVTFGGHDSWDDEKTWNYEVGYKTRKLGGGTSVNVALFYMDIDDLQTTVTAGTCSSRLVFNVPHARSRGIELEVVSAPSRSFDISFSGSYNDAELRSTVTSNDGLGNISVVSGIEEGRRLPSVPELQGALSAIYRFEVGKGSQMYVTGTWQYVGSRFTQVGDEDLGTLDMTALGNAIGGPLTQSTFTYDPKLPAYDILNLRAGLRTGAWDISAYVNNALDELAYLALERERGTFARIGYLTNQPRTFGIATRYSF